MPYAIKSKAFSLTECMRNLNKIESYEVYYYRFRKLRHMLAEELSGMGHEVIGAEVSASRVDSIKEKIATALCWMQQMNRHLPFFP